MFSCILLLATVSFPDLFALRWDIDGQSDFKMDGAALNVSSSPLLFARWRFIYIGKRMGLDKGAQVDIQLISNTAVSPSVLVAPFMWM